MILIPKEKPVVENLNSYYLNIRKLVEHYQGELSAGAVRFHSQLSEAVLFFDEQNIVSGFFEDRKKKLHGREAIKHIIESSEKTNFIVSVYSILPERLYFWANLPRSKVIYKDLSSEFTDLEGLIKKLETENFTGYIDVDVKKDKGGLLFIYKGEVIGGSSSDGAGDVDRSSQYRQDLIARSKEHGGIFNVSRVVFEEKDSEKSAPVSNKKPAVSHKSDLKKEPEPSDEKTISADISLQRTLELIAALLKSLESTLRSGRKIRGDFETMLNRKFVEKADRYEFLDPFAAEFRYAGGKVQFSGKADQAQLVAAIVECVTELAENHGVFGQLHKNLDGWRRDFLDEIIAFDINL
jgi:hypothetical protein